MPSQNAKNRKAQKKAAAKGHQQQQQPQQQPHKHKTKPTTDNKTETEIINGTSDQLFPSSEAANNLDFKQNGIETMDGKEELNLESLNIEDTDRVATEIQVIEFNSEPSTDIVPELAPSDVHISDDEDKVVKSKIPLESERGVSGVLASHPESRDLHLEQVTISSHGSELLSDAKIELNYGRRYGLVGLNGSGKTTLLQAIAAREVPIPDHFDIYLHQEEAEACDKTALQMVVEVDEEKMRIEEEVAVLSGTDNDELVAERISELYERLDEMDASTAETRAAAILHGLGFTRKMMDKSSKDFSGGWRMRIALAKALFVKPQILLLDEPTNHLDLCACVWLEEELKKYTRILVLVSHSQDFMNGVCTNMIHLAKQLLFSYGGNYDAYVRTREELEEHQMKRHTWEQGQIKHMKDYVARFGHGSAKLARQAQSKEKVLAKMVAGGLTEKVVSDKVVHFSFPDCGSLPPPVVMVQNVSFRYADDQPWIYKDLDFGIDLETRVALVGPNGVGKSTLLKMLEGEVAVTDGMIRRHNHLKIGRYHQHLKEWLDLNLSAVEHLINCFPDSGGEEAMRRALGQFGLSGKQQICPMRNLSEGQRCRIVFAWLSWNNPHLLLLDEPTNHLDMESIDALADAINEFPGGLILVSHDFRLINQVNCEVWVCQNGRVEKWEGDILTYKQHLQDTLKPPKKSGKKKTGAKK